MPNGVLREKSQKYYLSSYSTSINETGTLENNTLLDERGFYASIISFIPVVTVLIIIIVSIFFIHVVVVVMIEWS